MLRRLMVWLVVLMVCALLYRSTAVWCEEEATNEAAKAEDKAEAHAEEGEKGKEAEEAVKPDEDKAGEERNAEKEPSAEDEAQAEKAKEAGKNTEQAEEGKPEAAAEESEAAPKDNAEAAEKPANEGESEAKEDTEAAETAGDKTSDETEAGKTEQVTPPAAEREPERERRIPWWRRGRRAVNYEEEERPARADEDRAMVREDLHKEKGEDTAQTATAEAAAKTSVDGQKGAKIKVLTDAIRASLDYRAQSKAAQDIIALGPPTAPEVLALLDDSAPLVRVFGVLILRELKDPTAVAALWRLLDDPDAQIRYHAGLALTKIAGRNLGYYYNENPEDRKLAIQRVAEMLVQGGYMAPPAKAEKQPEGQAPAEQKSGVEVVSEGQRKPAAKQEAESPKRLTAPKAEKPRQKKAETPPSPPSEKKRAAETPRADEVGSARPPKWVSETTKRFPSPDDY